MAVTVRRILPFAILKILIFPDYFSFNASPMGVTDALRRGLAGGFVAGPDAGRALPKSHDRCEPHAMVDAICKPGLQRAHGAA
jgi:hypothetical protein